MATIHLTAEQFKKDIFEDNFRYFKQKEPTLEDVPLGYRYPEQTNYSTDWFHLVRPYRS